MKHYLETGDLLQITISPETVYPSTSQDISSYANVVTTVKNNGTEALSIEQITIQLPTNLAPAYAINSITPVADNPGLWSFGPSPVTPGTFEAIPQAGDSVSINAGATWVFTLEMVTLINYTGKTSAAVPITVNFTDKTTKSESPVINILPAVARIDYFNSQPSNINPGETVELNWQCKNIAYCIVSPGDGSPSQTNSLSVTPEATTVYTLYAYGDGVILSAQWAITVGNPQVVKFGTPDGVTVVNMGDSITLVWECNQYTESIGLTNTGGLTVPALITGANTPNSGSIQAGPITVPDIFTFTAYGADKSNFNTATATISLNDVTVNLSASPDSGLWIQDTFTLSWDITNAGNVVLSPEVSGGPSMQNLSGSVTIDAGSALSQQYELAATGFVNGEPDTVNALVTLNFEPVIINQFILDPPIINPVNNPNSTTLIWNTQAQVVSIDNNIGSVGTNSNYVETQPPNGTSYTLTAGTNRFPQMLSQTVQVFNMYGPYLIEELQIDPFFDPGTIFIFSDPSGFLLSIPVPCDIELTGVDPSGQFEWIQGPGALRFVPGTFFSWAGPNPAATMTIIQF